MSLIIAGIDPGYAHGGFSALSLPGHKLRGILSMPTTSGEIPDRVDQAVRWFRECISAATPHLLAIENQHRATCGASERGRTSANPVWVREVVGGVRCWCDYLGIPVRLVEPSDWRSTVGLGMSASKKQAWDRFCKLCGVVSTVTNEHSRDSAVIAYAGSRNAHLWLAEWKAKSKT